MSLASSSNLLLFFETSVVGGVTVLVDLVLKPLSNQDSVATSQGTSVVGTRDEASLSIRC